MNGGAGPLAGRAAFVAGAASGIGAATARHLHALGARVVCADRDRDGAVATARGLERALALPLEACDEYSWEGALAAAGPIDALVNCVGVAGGAPLDEMTLAEWRRVLSINLDGAFLATKHGIRALRERGGVIVHVGSASGIRPAAGAAAYSASKAGLAMLARTAAKELRKAGVPVRVNVVSPAGVKTPLWRSMNFFRDLVASTGSEEAAFAAISRSGGGAFTEPEDVAAVIGFVVSDAARHLTGVELPVDDGWTL